MSPVTSGAQYAKRKSSPKNQDSVIRYDHLLLFLRTGGTKHVVVYDVIAYRQLLG